MPSTTIEVHFKKTGESIDVPISDESRIQDIIKYACERSIRRNEINYENYYLVLSNNQEMLDNDKTLKETKALTVEYPMFQLCMKTVIREQIMDLARQNLAKSHNNKTAKVEVPVDGIKSDEIVTNNHETQTKSDAEVDPSIVSTSMNSDSIMPSSSSISLSCAQSKDDENVAWRTSNKISNDDVLKSPLSEKLANTYQHVTKKICEVGGAVTDDPHALQDISNAYKEINIVLCGSARVGKTTLVNAICQQKLAKTNSGLDSCTNVISRYVLTGEIEVASETIKYQYNFWDTPGFESWTKEKIRKRLEAILKEPKSDILCMIYCASPGSYANLQQLRWLLDECMKKQIFCALVCTNKWAGQKSQRDAVLEEFQQLLQHFHEKTREENGIFYFGNMGLCTAVNSQKFVDEDSGKEFEPSGVNELIFGIMESLDDEKVAQWCMIVFENKSFWDHVFKLPKQLKAFWKRLTGKA